MNIKFQELGRLHESIKPELLRAFENVLTTSSFVQGAYVKAFEEEFAAYVGIPHCLGVANGTDALEIALACLGVGPGDLVAVPAMTFMATAEAVVNVGAEPLFVDVDRATGCMTTQTLQAALERVAKPVKAAIAVHLYGRACDMKGLARFAQEKGMKLIEDCAQAHGARLDGRHVGVFSDIGTFSFYPGKNLGALGDAGAVVTGSREHHERMMLLRDHGRKEKYVHQTIGRNSRMDGLQAAFLSVKLRELEGWVAKRQQLASLYDQNLKSLDELSILAPEPRENSHAYHLYVVAISSGAERRGQLATFLANKGIETGIHYPLALHQQPAFQSLAKGLKLPTAEALAQSVLSLPLDPLMSPEQILCVCREISAFFKKSI